MVIQKNDVKIYCGDASKMSDVENDSVQLIITSPPYLNVEGFVVFGRSFKLLLNIKMGNVVFPQRSLSYRGNWPPDLQRAN